ncbi:MAG: dCTP deaminase domain-containing protein [Promethearchaeota archaeon]
MVVLSGIKVLSNIIDLIDPEKQLSVNGVDITISSIFKYKSRLEIDFDNSRRKNPKLERLAFSFTDDDNEFNSYWDLEPGVYMVGYQQKITVPMDCVGLMLPRSTFMAGGVLLATALWDSGYSGYGRGQMVVNNPFGVRIYNHARIGQIIFIKTEEVQSKGYNGIYQNEGKR